MKIFASYLFRPDHPFSFQRITSGTKATVILLYIFLSVIGGPSLKAQNKVWSVDDCIKYALEQNIQVLKAKVVNDINEANLLLSKSARLPSVSGSARQNIDWSNQTDRTSGATVFSETNGTNISASSNITIFNALKIKNNIRKSETEYEAGKYNVDVIKESVSLNVLNAYIQVLYAEELVMTNDSQVISTAEQLKLAEERMKLGVISNSDYLLVKSQLATAKLTLATAQSQLSINRVNLMQLMELPVNDQFNIARPNFDTIINRKQYPGSKEVYNNALLFKPEVKNAEMNKKSSLIDIDLAKADYFPRISMDAGVSTLYSSNNTASNFGSQVKDNISPAIGLSVSIPIYSNRQVKTKVGIARMNTTNAELDESNTKNQLRKAIEQSCLDVISSQIEYDASTEQFQAVKESFDVASEKYFQGIMNSVDFLIQRTNFISAESKFLQSKYKLVFSYKILDFYLGIPLSL